MFKIFFFLCVQMLGNFKKDRFGSVSHDFELDLLKMTGTFEQTYTEKAKRQTIQKRVECGQYRQFISHFMYSVIS